MGNSKVGSLSSEELVSRIMISVINYKENEDKLDDFPVIRKGSFAVLMQLCIGEKNEEGNYTAALTVTKSMLEQWGMPEEKLFEIAVDNSKKLFPITYQPLTEYLDHGYVGSQVVFPDGLELSNIMVLTNEQHYNGAATIFYNPSVLSIISEQYASAKIMLVPSSVNQVYCIPITNGDDLKDAKAICEEFLQMLTEEEKLAENALLYDDNTQMVTEANGQTYSLELTETAIRKLEYGGR